MAQGAGQDVDRDGHRETEQRQSAKHHQHDFELVERSPCQVTLPVQYQLLGNAHRLRPNTLVAMAASGPPPYARSVYRPDQRFYLIGMRAEVFCELIEIRISDFRKSGLVDVGDDFDPHRTELRC